MSQTVYDAIVVGLGAMGSAAAAHLAQRGQVVLGLEAFAPGHTLGSSHGESRIIRMAYFEHPDYVPLLKRAWELWAELEAQTAQTLLHVTGGLFIGPPDGDLVAGSRRSAEIHGLPHELLDAAAIRARFPQFAVRDGEAGLFEHQSGVLRPERCIDAQTSLARQGGATLHYEEPVMGWSVGADDLVRVHTRVQTYNARRLVVTAGAWASRLLTELDLPLEPERIPLFWIAPQPGAEPLFALESGPVWIWQDPRYGDFFGTPHMDWPGVKVGQHHTGVAIDPSTSDRAIRPTDDVAVREFLARCMPELTGPTVDARVCIYTNTPDRNFLVDLHPRYPNVAFAAGFSGHGFKFAPLIGEILADLVLTGRARAEADFLRLRPERFPTRAV